MAPDDYIAINQWTAEVARSGGSRICNTLNRLGEENIITSSTNNIVSTSSDIQRFDIARHLPSRTLAATENTLRFGLQSFATEAPFTHARQQSRVNSYSSLRPDPTQGNAMSCGPHNSTATSFSIIRQPLSPPVEIEDVLATIESDPLFTQHCNDTLKAPSYSQNGSCIPTQGVSSQLSSEVGCEIMPGEIGSTHQYEKQPNEAKADQHCNVHSSYQQIMIVQDGKGENVKRGGKDNKYWERRLKNNLAARRSRAAKRNRQIAVEHTTALLRKENASLKAEVLSFREENEHLKRLLQFN